MTNTTVTGSAKKVPWSGWWWPTGHSPPPMAKVNGPLDKFDQYIQNLLNENPGARQWELANHYTPGCGWCGHCHGWAAASILESEPTKPVTRQGITFGVGDLKGLLTEVHCTDHLDLWEGVRDVLPPIEDDKLEAHIFHQVLLDWVGNGEAVVMDKTKKPEVWNHPVHKFEMTAAPDVSDPNKTHIVCNLWFVSDGVDQNFVGTKDFTQTYEYWITGDFHNPSYGDWKQEDHPGFIWHPDYVNTQAVGANPAIKYYDPYIEDLTRCGVLFIAIQDFAAIIPVGPIVPDLGPDGPINPLLFRGLVALDASEGYAVPAMAAAWEISPDGQLCAFHLRPEVTFHDGARLTAEDVAFSYHLFLEPEMGFPFREALTEIIDGVDAVDDLTVAFRLKRPMFDFPAAHGWHWVLPKHVVEEEGLEGLSRHPIGSGPFAFESRELDDRLTLVANSSYYLGTPLLERIVFLGVPDVDLRLLLLAAGEAEIGLFEYTLELERRAQEIPHMRTFAIPADSPERLEVQSVTVQGRFPNEFDGAWNAEHWDIRLDTLVRPTIAPEGRLRPRRLMRREKRMSVNESKMGFPEWREGVWWQVQVRQRALPARTPDPGWTLPNRLLFEVIGEDVVDDKRCYLIRVTYPDRPRVAEHKFADVWISAEERAPVQGTLHIGDRHIPMRYDFLMKLLRTTPMRVNIEGIPRTVLDPRRPEERVELEAFEIRTPTGGVCLSSLAAPFPSRIEEPDYVVELQDWGG